MFNPLTSDDPATRPPLQVTGAIAVEQALGLLKHLQGPNVITNRRWRDCEGSHVGRRISGGSDIELSDNAREALLTVTSLSDPHDVVVALNETRACFHTPTPAQVIGARGFAVRFPLDAHARAAFPGDPDKAVRDFLKRVVQPIYVRALLANTRPMYICDAMNKCVWIIFIFDRIIGLFDTRSRKLYRKYARRLADLLDGDTGGDPLTAMLPVPGVAWVQYNVAYANVWGYDFCGMFPEPKKYNGSTLDEIANLVGRIVSALPVTPENYSPTEGAQYVAAVLAERGIKL